MSGLLDGAIRWAVDGRLWRWSCRDVSDGSNEWVSERHRSASSTVGSTLGSGREQLLRLLAKVESIIRAAAFYEYGVAGP
jgi:hypothetical protein